MLISHSFITRSSPHFLFSSPGWIDFYTILNEKPRAQHLHSKYLYGCLPERDDVVRQPPSCLDVPPSMFCPGVFTSVLLQPSISPFPHLSSAASADSRGESRLLHILQTAVKQGGSQKRRSSHLFSATGLYWFQNHVGLLSCFFSRFGKKKKISISELTEVPCSFVIPKRVRASENKTNIPPKCGPGRQKSLCVKQRDRQRG